MNLKRISIFTIMAIAMVALVLALGGSDVAHARSFSTQYQVTILNLSEGQPLSPPIVATHRGRHTIGPGRLASPELEAMAEDGNQLPLFEALSEARRVTDVVDVGRPLTRIGTTVGEFTDYASVEITARPGDRLSVATMLICTNDGLALLPGARLPHRGSAAYPVYGYDAGTEDNTELSGDLVDPCSGLGPVTLDGDPNGNENDAVDADPQEPIRFHPGIQGDGDLSEVHDWDGPVAVVIVTPIGD